MLFIKVQFLMFFFCVMLYSIKCFFFFFFFKKRIIKSFLDSGFEDKKLKTDVRDKHWLARKRNSVISALRCCLGTKNFKMKSYTKILGQNPASLMRWYIKIWSMIAILEPKPRLHRCCLWPTHEFSCRLSLPT